MIHKRTVWFLTILAVFMWSVLGSSPSTFATAHLEPVIEQMVTLVKSPGQILVKESWYHTQSKDERHDELQYSYAGSEEIESRRMILKEQEKKVYKMIQKQGKTTEETGTSPYQTAIRPGKTLFQSLLDAYQTSEWTSTGTVGLDSKLAEKKIRVVRESAAVYTEVVYLEKQTGLPMKKEYYQGSDISKAPEITEVYFFEKVHDPAGAVFTIPNSQTHETAIEHVKRMYKTGDGKRINYSRIWYDRRNEDERIEDFTYDFLENKSRTKLTIISGQRINLYTKSTERDEVTEKLEQTKEIPRLLSSFQTPYGPKWNFVENKKFNGRTAQVYERIDDTPKVIYREIALVDGETGLPIKEEMYTTFRAILDMKYLNVPNPEELEGCSIYVFEDEHNPIGTLFTAPID
ncbi:hypothetical protein NDK47_20845 [Brevibacillus ruminantium]|uniref:Uncharacterized protein n=1 Tax=Brevibacillus ruminantium TaxID=2950604 RepID=A0ABY4WFI4_9BACL|nr:hypothetical protein [Brevibacillus ruminantium]USG64570.1 hypothetical protein NDK47_20845 [Brevibacillus ruminantium]